MSLSKPRFQYKTLTLVAKVVVDKGLKKKCDIAKEFGIAPNKLSKF